MDDVTAPQQVRLDPNGLPMIGAYPDFANPDLLDAIPLTARTVLDIGCGGGALGAAYRRRNPRARVLGVDTHPESIALARTRLTEAAHCDVQSDPLPFDLPDGIDCLIYGDILEHLADPWAVLARHAEQLNPDGTVLVCFPNVENWSIVYRLLKGSFDYEDEGLLDRTHLRWFTPRMMAAALEQAGLALCDVRPRLTNPTEATRFVEAMTPALKAIGVDPAEYLNRAIPIQFVWRAKKQPRPRLVLATTMLPPVGGVSDVRVIEPVRALASDASVLAAIRPEAEIALLMPEAPHIAVLHRPLLLGEPGLGRVRALIDKGYLVVTEFDDHPGFLEGRGVATEDLLTFSAAHAVQTSTEALAAVLTEYNPEIAVFPNAIVELPEPRNFAAPDRMTLFFGALNREEDWAPYMPVLNEVLRAVGARLNVLVLHDRGFFDALDTANKEFVPTSDYATYMQRLGEAEICLMPLADTAFNRAKSDLKFIEASAARVVSLASPVVYEASIRDGETGLLFRSPDHLRMQLLRLLAYPEAAKRLAEAARAHIAAERMLAYQLRARIDWYHSLWARRDELTEALRKRVPALFA
ncbi:methyltransferase domain-containing protein [Acidiphilium sp. AL]|uniref:Methyltransferase domain-containing protein n=1 Tax=Acidiphilium iwatense TaxID=768198 RepID=A0ABS9DSY6_9PROT|nr:MULTISPECIES: methyltransferase domain-containing protein [Acidiphilium]MCF3945838.1 methyltransferase domain-containing protein [Acidiphilium iwatense]MCU4161139.1 methyltransferase domain-containing protein [Acidiphilium sp. AL]